MEKERIIILDLDQTLMNNGEKIDLTIREPYPNHNRKVDMELFKDQWMKWFRATFSQ